jgi:Protein of unknown function (DUF2281)
VCRLSQTGPGMSTTADKIFDQARKLPEPLAREVLDFLEYLEVKHGLRDMLSEDLKAAPEPAMRHVWENPEDEVWDDL